MRTILFLTLGLCVSVSSPASAQSDAGRFGEKKGLIVGLGLGGAMAAATTATTQFGETTETTESNAAVAGDFRFGGGLSERFLLYWFGKTAWYNGDDSFGVATQTSTVSALSGIGASYLPTPRVYLGAGVGASALTTNRETAWGLGLQVGAEYEFARHWLVGADVLFGSPQPDQLEGIDRETSTFAARLTVGWLHY